MPTSPISIQPISPSDFYPIAAFEAHIFSADPISVYALGPQRATPSALQKRAQSLANAHPPSACPPTRMRKAVTASGQLVGFAFWKFFTDLERSTGESPIDQDGGGEEERRVAGEGGGAGAPGEQQQGKWPEGANVQLCEMVFGRSDECCRVVMRGRKYAGKGWHFLYEYGFVYPPNMGSALNSLYFPARAKCMKTWQVVMSFSVLLTISHNPVLSILVVSPDYQGRGIGTMLIREGLEVVDEMGLPTWLGATDVALPLYKKVGFEVDRVFEFDMVAYGGEGLMNHTLMIRPAEQKESVGALN